MARIAGVDLPRRKGLAYALPYLYGIGPKTAREICEKTGIPNNKKVEELTDADVKSIRDVLDADYKVVALDDWSNAEVTDPATDFTLYFAAAGREALEDLIRRYEFAGGMTWPRMADQAEMYYWASPVKFAAYAMRTGDLSHLMNVKNMVHRYASMLEDSGYE